MASPQESITTVNGRRCTRSRVRFAASSSVTSPAPAIVTTTEIATSTTLQQAQLQTSAAAVLQPAPPPPSSAVAAPPSSAAPVNEPAAAPTPPAAASSAIGTPSAVSVPPAQAPVLANIVVSSSGVPAVEVSGVPAAVPAVPVEFPTSSAAVASPQVITPITSVIPLATPSISSDTSTTAISLPLGAQSSLPIPVFASPAESAVSGVVPEQPSPTSLLGSVLPGIAASSIPAASSLPTGDSAAGVIAPGRAPGQPEEQGLTIPSSGNASVGSIVGGVIGGVGGLAVICAILFIFLRKRNREEPRWFEKSEDRPKLVDRFKVIPEQIGVMFAKIKGQKKGPSGNTYQRHSQQGSVSSVYSVDGRSRSISEPQGAFAIGVAPQRSSSRASRFSKKGDRNVLRKKNSSISSQSTFAGIMAELDRDPFSDPEPPKTLLLLNPDPNSPRGPVTPRPAVTGTIGRNPFASPLDNGTDDVLARPPLIGHRRNRSSASALSSNPPEMFTPDPSKPSKTNAAGPPPPNQAVLPGPKRRSSIAYPNFNTTSTTDSHDSFYGEPGPSRPPTNLFTPGLTPGLPTGRTVRQSDPFDLDRPEVLGFGSVVGRREVRGSVTRQGTINRRTSSVGNWYNASDQVFERDSAVPRPLWSAGGRR